MLKSNLGQSGNLDGEEGCRCCAILTEDWGHRYRAILAAHCIEMRQTEGFHQFGGKLQNFKQIYLCIVLYYMCKSLQDINHSVCIGQWAWLF